MRTRKKEMEDCWKDLETMLLLSDEHQAIAKKLLPLPFDTRAYVHIFTRKREREKEKIIIFTAILVLAWAFARRWNARGLVFFFFPQNRCTNMLRVYLWLCRARSDLTLLLLSDQFRSFGVSRRNIGRVRNHSVRERGKVVEERASSACCSCA